MMVITSHVNSLLQCDRAVSNPLDVLSNPGHRLDESHLLFNVVCSALLNKSRDQQQRKPHFVAREAHNDYIQIVLVVP